MPGASFLAGWKNVRIFVYGVRGGGVFLAQSQSHRQAGLSWKEALGTQGLFGGWGWGWVQVLPLSLSLAGAWRKRALRRRGPGRGRP